MLVRLGARIEGTPGPKYRRSLNFAEIAFSAGLPKPAKLRGQTSELAPFASALVAPRELIFDHDGLPHTSDVRSPFDRIGTAVTALGASSVVLETGSALSPSQRDRKRIQAYFETLKATTPQTELIWRAGGLWEPEQVIEFSAEIGCTPSVDPFSNPIPEHRPVYLFARAEGVTKRFGDEHFVRLIDELEAFADDDAEVSLVLESDRSFREATRLKNLLLEAELLATEEPPAGQ